MLTFSLGGYGVQTVFSITNFTRISNCRRPDSSSNSMAADYLVKSLGFSKNEAIETVSKVRTYKFTEKVDSIVDYFTQNGLDRTQIKDLVNYVPEVVLACRFDKTLKPKFRVFQDMGLSVSELVQLILESPGIWKRRLSTQLLPTIEFLKKTLLMRDENVLRVVKKAPWLFKRFSLKSLSMNVALLQNYGFSVDKIEQLLLCRPRYFGLEPERLEAILIKVEETFKISPGSPMFMQTVCAASSFSEKNLESKVALLRSFGWTDKGILRLFWKKYVVHLAASESEIRRKLNYLMNNLGYDPAQMASQPGIIGYSLEKRIIPRSAVVKVLREKGLIKCNLVTVVQFPESRFVDRFVLPFKEEVLHVYEDHKKNINSQAAK